MDTLGNDADEARKHGAQAGEERSGEKGERHAHSIPRASHRVP
jgi:hypothetical protein